MSCRSPRQASGSHSRLAEQVRHGTDQAPSDLSRGQSDLLRDLCNQKQLTGVEAVVQAHEPTFLLGQGGEGLRLGCPQRLPLWSAALARGGTQLHTDVVADGGAGGPSVLTPPLELAGRATRPLIRPGVQGREAGPACGAHPGSRSHRFGPEQPRHTGDKQAAEACPLETELLAEVGLSRAPTSIQAVAPRAAAAVLPNVKQIR